MKKLKENFTFEKTKRDGLLRGITFRSFKAHPHFVQAFSKIGTVASSELLRCKALMLVYPHYRKMHGEGQDTQII